MRLEPLGWLPSLLARPDPCDDSWPASPLAFAFAQTTGQLIRAQSRPKYYRAYGKGRELESFRNLLNGISSTVESSSIRTAPLGSYASPLRLLRLARPVALLP